MKNIYTDIADLTEGIIGKDIILVGGCFDIIHPGHIDLFKYAQASNLKVLVALLSDKYIKSYKSNNRPILSEKHRAEILSSIKYIDYVYIIDASTSSENFIKKIQPKKVLFQKPTDKKSQKIINREKSYKINSPDTEIIYVERFRNDISTSIIIDKILDSD